MREDAYPPSAVPMVKAISLRDWFAGQVLPTILAMKLTDPEERAYEHADAMLIARRRKSAHPPTEEVE